MTASAIATWSPTALAALFASPGAASATSLLFATAVLALVVLERLAELRLSRRNVRLMLARGGVEIGRSHYRWMVLLHTGFLVAIAAEWWIVRPPWSPTLALAAVLVLAGSMTLRYWAILSLGDRWSTRIVCEPGRPLVAAGPYRWLRHPNYVAVVLEFAALPLVHGAWRTALIGTLLNAWMLRVRLASENRALAEFPSSRGDLARSALAEDLREERRG